MAVTISNPVGRNATNLKADVLAIQQALNDVPTEQGGAFPKLLVDGFVGKKTTDAILLFQRAHAGLVQDAVVSKAGATIQTINAILDPPSALDPRTLAFGALPLALIWAQAGLTALTTRPANFEAALETHFHLSKGKLHRAIYLQLIKTNYERVLDVGKKAATFFRSRNDAEARADQGVDAKTGVPFPAYTFFRQSVNFTREFRPFVKNGGGFGELCRTAMVLHETVHYVDQLANTINDIYEHSDKYPHISPDVAVHNPSSFVCFAQQIWYGEDRRYGAGRPED